MKEIITNKKNLKVFGIAALVTLIVLSSFSYAYFIGSIGGSASTDVDVTTSVNERLVFTEGNPIGIHATLDNFSEGDGSLTGETTTNVKLNAGSQSSTATELYQVYFDITANDFDYSVDNTTPELVLTITDPEGDTLTEATLPDGTTINTKTVTTLVQDGLGGTTSQSVVGFDVTEVTGIIKLYEDYSITNTNPTVATEQNWIAKITFINLDAEQKINEGKTFNANLLLQQDKITTGNKMISGPEFAVLTSEYRLDMINGSPATKDLHKIIFKDTINETAYNNATDKWDVSEAADESVVAYVVTENTDEVMYIESNGKILAHDIQGDCHLDILDNVFTGTSIFLGIPNLNSIEFNDLYNTENVTNMSCMFAMSSNINNLSVSSFDTSNVTNMSGMFLQTLGLTSLDVTNFNTSKVTNMSYMFTLMGDDRMLGKIATLDLSNFNTSKVTDMSWMFSGQPKISELNLINFNTENLTNMQGMFAGVGENLDFENDTLILNLTSFDTSKVTDMSYTFIDSPVLRSLNLSNFDTNDVIDMQHMFRGLNSIETLDLSSFNTNKVTNMDSMFAHMNNLVTLNLSNFNTDFVTNMEYMFYRSYSLTNLDISSFNTTNLINYNNMFDSMNVMTESLYAKTQLDADKFNDRDISGLNYEMTFVVKP